MPNYLNQIVILILNKLGCYALSILFVSSLIPIGSAFGQSKKLMNNYQETRSISETLNSLVRQIESISERSVCLNTSASENEIAKVETTLGQNFPEDLRSLYKIANGQSRDGECASIFWDGQIFLSLSELEREWAFMKELWESDENFRHNYGVQGAVQGFHWTPDWIPIGSSGNGDSFCLDFSPSEQGRVGQIIEFIHDNPRRLLVGTDIKSFIGSLDNALSRGVATYRRGYGVRTHKQY